MKKNQSAVYKILFVFLIFSMASCTTSSIVEIKTEFAETPKVNIEDFDEITIADFLSKKDKPDFDINKEVKEYFAQELKVKTNKKTNTINMAPKDEKSFNEKEFWAGGSEKEKKEIIITGSVEYKSEIRKALVKEKRKFEDPFTYEDRFAQLKRYSLVLDLYFIDSQTGGILYQKKITETKAYKNPNQTSYFAFYDLIYNVKEKVFRDVLDKKSPQRRYLILR